VDGLVGRNGVGGTPLLSLPVGPAAPDAGLLQVLGASARGEAGIDEVAGLASPQASATVTTFRRR
jgi:ABC-type molybdenum transport system ATPase subunit/photorepair protein PhrA